MVTLESIRRPVEEDLERFEAFVRRNFKVDNELLSGMVDYILSARGKGIRPLLVLLSAAMNSAEPSRGIGQRAYLAAMIIELVHTASLVHDDVIDESDTRRGRPSANALWQSHTAVVLGDYLLARTMDIGLHSGQYDILTLVCNSIATLCEGEILQNERARRLTMTRADYLDIIYKKTASLIGLSAAAGAMAVGAPHERIAAMRRFGDALGIAFQIQDDILDYTHGTETGKPANNDLREHKVTLPLLILLDRAEPERRSELIDRLARCHEDESSVEYLQRLVENEGGLRDAARVLREYLDRAAGILAQWPDSPYRSALVDLCAYVAERNR